MNRINAVNISNQSTHCDCYIKLVYTCFTNNYKVEKNLSMREFLNSIKKLIQKDPIFQPFQLIQSDNTPSDNTQYIDVIPMGTPEGENATPLLPSDEYFNPKKINSLGFYIRFNTPNLSGLSESFMSETDPNVVLNTLFDTRPNELILTEESENQ